jgi:hypothetical protein
MKAGTPDHPKMLELADAIQAHMAEGDMRLPHGVCLALANGMIERMLHFAARYCPNGGIGKNSDRQIATAMGWPFDAEWLVSELVDRKWLDSIPGPNRLYIHDWHTHCEDFTHKKLARGVELFANWAVPKFTRLDDRERSALRLKWGEKFGVDIDNPPAYAQTKETDARNGHSVRTPGVQNGDLGTVPVPVPVPVSNTSSAAAEGVIAKVNYSAAFESWYFTYPRKVGKQAASAAYGRAIGRIASARGISRQEAHAALLETTLRYAASPAGTAGKYTPHPATWLNDGRYDDDPAEWKRTEQADRTPHVTDPGESRKNDTEGLAFAIIKSGRRAKKPDEAIKADLAAAGLTWPS